jgi:hypothetical protein
VCEVGGRVGKRNADVVDGGCGGFCVAVSGWRKVGLVDANGVIEFDWWERAQMRLENIREVREGQFLLVEELGCVSLWISIIQWAIYSPFVRAHRTQSSSCRRPLAGSWHEHIPKFLAQHLAYPLPRCPESQPDQG